jgi:Serine dehydrogenase proteinase
MTTPSSDPAIVQVLMEEGQSHGTRKALLTGLGDALGRPVVTFFTSFRFPVMIEDTDADMLEGVLQKLDLSSGLVLFISSPGGDGLAAERIINVCRTYSGTGEYWVVVPGKAKSAATMVCFGASKILMSQTSELGPIDPQLTVVSDGVVKRFSVFNIVESYKELFNAAVVEPNNLQPYLQQLANYDARELKEFEAALALSHDIAMRTLRSGMMSGKQERAIKSKIKVFLTPERTKSHGRPIYRDEAQTCGLAIRPMDVTDPVWEQIYELYLRTDNFVNDHVSKCIETADHSFSVPAPSF